MTWNTHTQLCIITLAILIAGAILTGPASALKVEGARIALDIETGATYTSPIGISIKPDEAEGDFAIDVMGFGQSPADGTYTGLEAAQDTSPYSARPFITINKPKVHLKPGERADVTATITVPSGIRDGGRYAIIMVHPAASASGAPAAFATAVAIPVFLTVKVGTVTEAGEILGIEPAAADPWKPFQVVTNFRNSGNYHYYGAVNNVTISNAQGKTLGAINTEPFSRAIIPGQSVKFTNAISSGLPQGTYQLTSRIYAQDGELLAEKKTTLQVGSPVSVQDTQAQAQVTPTRTAPGFGTLLAVVALSVIFTVAFRSK